MAAAAIAAANEQKDLAWVRTGNVKKKPGLSDPMQLFSLVEVLSSNGTGPEAELTCKVVDSYWNKPEGTNYLPQGGGLSEGEEVQIQRKDTLPANPPSQDMVKDLGELDNLHEAGLLHCMGMRYCGGHRDDGAAGVTSWYSTFIGAICIATNPFAPQKAWKNSFKMEDYLSSECPVMENEALQPHPWSVADMCYNELLTQGNNQAVLICGESGAGKTECCKFVLAYLIAKKESTVENIDGKLMATNDPLEAFGNAKTVNNDNSSRFAKCMQICLDAEGRVIGAEIQTSLLEKARSCAFFQQERNFHILYMLPYYRHVKCEPEPGEKQQTDTSDALEMLGAKAHKYLLEADQFAFIKPGDVEVDTEGQRYRERFQAGDIDWFKRVISSFLTLGYARKDIDEMMELLTAILHMGNIEFTNEDASQCSESTKQHVEIVADCFGLDATQLQDEIVKERIMMGGSLISKELNKIKAMSSRDAICKSIFQTIFLDIVERCNIGIAGEKDRAKGRVGVLDIFGFERMQFNSLEQICINYTNEKLHQTFINEVFETEKKVYRDEGLDPSYIKFTDNAAVLEMTTGCNPHDTSGKSGATAADIKKKIKVSLFGILDDVCKQEKNTGVTYCERVMKQWTGAKDANGPLFEGPKFGAEEFSVVHFAGPVKYGTTEVDKTKFLPPSRWAKEGIDPTAPQIDSFLTKNKDKVPEFFAENSSNDYYKYITRPKEGVKVDPKAPKSIVGKFNLEIEAFFKQLLTGANPKFIRALNPRPKGVPAPGTMGKRFNLQRVLGQLRYTGILDTVRVRASGYIIRKKYELFAPEYVHPCNLLPEDNPFQGNDDDLTFANKLKEDPALSKEVIRALFGNPEYGVPKDEVLEGTSMIFIKKLTTIAKLQKKKEDMMVEVVIRERAKEKMIALSLKWLRHTHYLKMIQAASKLQRSQRVWLSIYGPDARKKKWLKVIDLARSYKTAFPIAETRALGFIARKRFAPTKLQAIADGKWVPGGGGLLKPREKKERAQGSGANGAPAVDFAKLASNVKVPAGSGLTTENLGAALGAGAAAAEAQCPRTDNEDQLKMSTRRFIDSQLQASLVRAVKALHRERPGPAEVQQFLLAVLQDQDPPAVAEQADTDTRIYDYLKSNGAFALLKPALLAVDRHRPQNPALYMATFLGGAVGSLAG